MVWPAGVTPYARKLRDHRGSQADDVYRMWFVENAPHSGAKWIWPLTNPECRPKVWTSRLVEYDGVTAEAMRQAVRWVEHDVAPTRSTAFERTDDGVSNWRPCEIDDSSGSVGIQTIHAYDKSGTYFVNLRAVGHSGDKRGHGPAGCNRARVRVGVKS